MAISEPEVLGRSDLADMMALSVAAGWNQTVEDWGVFLRFGHVFGIRAERRVVATAAMLPYGPFGFVSMVLTAAGWRGRGCAGRLAAAAMAGLAPAVAVLDATPAGVPVYARLGFRGVFGVRRWGSSRAVGGMPERIPPYEGADAFGADRGFLLREFAGRAGTSGPVRTGRVAAHIGPLVADDEDAAIAVLASTALPHPAVIDVPARCGRLGSWLETQGYSVQRGFTRMALGASAPFGDPARVFATAGPEFG